MALSLVQRSLADFGVQFERIPSVQQHAFCTTNTHEAVAVERPILRGIVRRRLPPLSGSVSRWRLQIVLHQPYSTFESLDHSLGGETSLETAASVHGIK